jgi:hypothetical protein
LTFITVSPDQTRPNQTKPDQTRPNQTKPNQTKPQQTKPQQSKAQQSIMYRSLRTVTTKAGVVGARWNPLAGSARPCNQLSSVSPAAAAPLTRRSMHHLAAAANGSVSSSWLTQTQNQLNQQQVRTVFIQTENTPNPESIKFVPSGRIVLETEDGTGYFVQKNDAMEDILKSPLATELFKIDGVKAVYLGFDFVTITKYAEHQW